MENKGIIYYTDNRIDGPIIENAKKYIKESGLTIVSCSLKPIDFGKNIVINAKRSYPTMVRQILTTLENSTAKYVFFCFQGDTCIETINGLKRIDSIKIGELVKTHLNRFKPVTNIFKTPYKQRSPLIQIYTKNSSIRCTPEHPFYVYKNNKKQWIPANSIVNGDILLYPYNNHEDYVDLNISFKSNNYNGKYGSMDSHIDKIKVDEDFARFMGLYLSEGHYNGKNGIGFTLNNNEKEYHQFIQSVCHNIFKRNAIVDTRNSWATQVLINIHELGPRFKEWFGDNARNKHIPYFVFDWNLKNRLSFILGLLNGDAAWHKQYKFYVGLSSSSKRLIEDTIKLMNKSGIGWDNNIKTKKNNTGFSKLSKEKLWIYRINISKKSYTKMIDLLESKNINNNYLGISVIDIKNTKMNVVTKYKNNNKIGFENYVYNLEVEEDNSYIAQSSIVHNCEHDVLYPKSHFDFTPKRDDIFYYNNNVLRWMIGEEIAITYDRMLPLSCMCCNRMFALEHYKMRQRKIEEWGLDHFRSREPRLGRVWGYEPGTKKKRRGGLTDDDFDIWSSKYPVIDIRHKWSFSSPKIHLKDFKHQPENWQEIPIEEVEGWDLKTLFKL